MVDGAHYNHKPHLLTTIYHLPYRVKSGVMRGGHFVEPQKNRVANSGYYTNIYVCFRFLGQYLGHYGVREGACVYYSGFSVAEAIVNAK